MTGTMCDQCHFERTFPGVSWIRIVYLYGMTTRTAKHLLASGSWHMHCTLSLGPGVFYQCSGFLSSVSIHYLDQS